MRSLAVLAVFLHLGLHSDVARADAAKTLALQADATDQIYRILSHGMSQARSYLPRHEYFYKPITLYDVQRGLENAVSGMRSASASPEKFSVATINNMYESPRERLRMSLSAIGDQHGAETAAAFATYLAGVDLATAQDHLKVAIEKHPTGGSVPHMALGYRSGETIDHSALLHTLAARMGSRFAVSQHTPRFGRGEPLIPGPMQRLRGVAAKLGARFRR